MNKRALIFRLTLVVALVVGISWFAFHREFFTVSRLEQQLQRFGRWAPISFVGLYALSTVLFVPGSVLTVVGGALFGPVWGTLWNLTGATLGATLAFVTARYVASDWVSRRAGERLARLIKGVEEEGWRFVAFVRLVPLFPFNLVNYSFGLTRIRLAEYVLASFVCMAPGAIAYTYLGYAGREAAAGNAGGIRNGLIALALLATVAFLPRLVRRLRASREFIDTPELKRRLEQAPQSIVIDVRGPDEFEGPLGHIPGARNIALSELSSEVQTLSALKDSPLVFVCKTDKRSAKAARLLREAGFHQVSVLRGGMESWQRCGYPVEPRKVA
ncbi:MAG: VTT domain-containing protein [Candidatus Binataceae bacterium]